MNKKWIITLALVALCSMAQAMVTINVNEVGNNVVFDWSGSLNITGAIKVDEAGGFATYVKPDWGQVWLYSSGNVFYYGLESGGPYNIGSGSGYNFMTTISGNSTFSMDAIYSKVGVGQFYVSGSSMYGTDTIQNTTISGLGITPGTYMWTMAGSGDTIEVAVGAVPEPTTLALAGLGVLGCLLMFWDRKS
jgi:hypothetical protein